MIGQGPAFERGAAARKVRTRIPRSLILAALLYGTATGAWAAAEPKVHYDIPAQRADAALSEFARQSGRQILFPFDRASIRNTPALSGDFTVTEALALLARAAGLVVASLDGRTIALVAAPMRPPEAPKGNIVARLLERREPREATAPAAALPQVLPVELLGEIVITSTRQSDIVNRVPISVTAMSQRTLDQIGLKTVQDLARTAGSVTFRRAGPEGNPSISIRGISSVLGSPTTGIYLDDTPLQKRDNAGSATGNGSPFPVLFDLERIEVLRGPQGTLYGGSAQGGAIRFITPAPSLVAPSAYARSSISSTENGGVSYEGGFAIGGPIVADKLGFRASILGRHTAGYIDQVSIYDGHVIAKDINRGNTRAVRLAVTFAPTNRLRITPAVYASKDRTSAQDWWWEDVPAFQLNPGTFTNAGVVNGVRFDFPDKAFAGGTFGPYNQFGPYKSGAALYLDAAGAAQKVNSPRTTEILLPTLTVDYDFPDVSAKAITSFLGDINKGYSGGLLGIRTAILPTATNAGYVGPAGAAVPGGAGAAAITFPGWPTQYRQFSYYNTRHGVVQELRLASNPAHRRLSWVAGVFFSNTNQRQHTQSFDNENDTAIFLRGIDEAWLLGQTNFAGSNSSEREVRINENQIAAFGEANYLLTERLKLTLGLRASRTRIRYQQQTGSSVQGAPADFVGAPGPPALVTDPACGREPLRCNSATFHPFPNLPGDDMWVRFEGVQSESPLTPKLGLAYQTRNDLYYLSVAKGYRTGGLNQPVPFRTCIQDLAALGLPSTPLTYKSDSVWSYEAGAKLKLLGGRAQVNSSAFYIDWKNPQLQNRLRCGQNYTVNAGHAVSKGFDIQAQQRFGGLTLSFQLAYTDARYTNAYSIPGTGNAEILIVNADDGLGEPKWQYNLGAEYNIRLAGDYGLYARANYQHNSSYQRGPGPGAAGYDAAIARGDALDFASARLGVTHGNWEFNLFVDNLTDAKGRLAQNHTAQSALVTSATFRPRETGLQLFFRY